MKPMKKKLFSILLAAVMVLSLIPAIAISASADPVVYNVSNCEELIEALTAHNTSKDPTETIRLTDDIILDMDTFQSFGNRYIYGTFDGQNHTIYNFGNFTSKNDEALFWPYGNCLIKDFTVSGKTAPDGDDLVITKQTSILGQFPVASEIAEGQVSVIRNVTNERSLTSGINNYGGFYFRSVDIGGTIRFENCTNKGNYQHTGDSNMKLAAFIGYMNNGTIEFVGCANEGNITSSQSGGFVATYRNGNSTIRMTNCTNSGTITGTYTSKCYGIAGGFIGGRDNGGAQGYNVTIEMTNCVNTGDILVSGSGSTKATGIGGLIGCVGAAQSGKTLSITLNNCSVYNCTISTNGTNIYAAPLIGNCSPGDLNNYTVTANNCYASRVNVIGGTARKLIGVGSYNANIESVKIINCVTNEVTNGSEEWGSNKFEGCVLKVTADAVNKNGFADTDTENVISDGLAPVYQQAAAAADQSKVRFLATLKNVDLNAYSKVGFFVTASFGDPATVKGWNLNGTTVYTSVIAAGETKSASEIYDGHTSETYIFAATIEGISFNESTEVTFYVTPYIINADGSILFGQTGELQNFF